MFKRFFLFFAINIIIVLTISLLLQFFHIGPYLTKHGLDYNTLMAFCLIWGMGGAFISLLLSRIMAKWLMGVKIIDPRTNNLEEKMIYDMVAKLSQKARLPDVPEVGIFSSNEPNAFATGPTKRRSLVAVSTGLISKLSKEEVEAVIGHEITHIANGDMVTMTLLQGVVNAFVMFLARVLAYAVSTALSKDSKNRSSSSYLTFSLFTFLFEVVFMIFGMMIIGGFSRYREFKADKGSAELLGKSPMIHALEKLEALQGLSKSELKTQSVAALMITSDKKQGFLHLFATHPPLSERIARLRTYR